MNTRPPWWSAAIGIFTFITALRPVAPYQLRVANPGVGLGLGLGSGPGRPPGMQSYLALSGDLVVEIRQLPVWARGRRLQLMLLEHATNGPPVATTVDASALPEFTVQGSIPVSVPTNAMSTAANTGGRLQWVRGYNRTRQQGQAGSSLGKMTSTWRPSAGPSGEAPRAARPRAQGQGRVQGPTTLKPIVARFPCGFVSRGGRYALRLAGLDRTKKTFSRKDEEDLDDENESSERAPPPTTTTTTTSRAPSTAPSTAATPSNTTTGNAVNDPALPATNETNGLFLFEVLWPQARLTLSPREIVTYPEDAVKATVEFLGVRCPTAKGSPVSESWLELVYCGPVLTDCDYNNYTQRQILHSEQVLGYPHLLAVALKCELFGMAGYYSLHLRAARPTLVPLTVDAGANATIKAVWSDRFVFNVHARSIFPCAAHSGVSALFTYPGCVLPAGDRVRLFARLRADVSTLVPPLTLQYVAEQRVARGAHAVAFDCDLFSERYVEYCFVYVSQAITGAVTDVRMDCVPTLPVSEADSGSWGPWSEWSACTSTCGGGTRNRYRFCDSPPPRYGAKFCEGSSLETMRCGPDNEWDCAPEGVSADVPVQVQVGLPTPKGAPGAPGAATPAITSGCRCGCVVHLGTTKPATMLASSSKSCPGRSFWLVQADANHVVKLWVQQDRLSCGAQWLRVRDGDSLAGRLLLALDQAANHPGRQAVSSSNTMLVEFYSDEAVAALEECAAGFLAHAQQTVPANETLVGYPLAVAGAVGAGLGAAAGVGLDDASWWVTGLRLTIVHAAAVAFLGAVVVLSACLCAQYGHRYRKYQLTAGKEDQESLTDNEETGIFGRAASSATLVSEVVSLKGFKMSREQQRADEVDVETSAMSEPRLGSADSMSGSVTVSVGSPESAGTLVPDVADVPDVTASLPNSPQLQSSPMRRSESLSACKASGEEGGEDGQRHSQQHQPARRPSNVRIGPRLKSGLVSPVREEDNAGAPPAAPLAPARGPSSGPSSGPSGGPRVGAAVVGATAAQPGTAKWRPLPRMAAGVVGLAKGVASNASSTSTLVNGGGSAVAPGSPASSVRSWSRASSRLSTSTNLSTSSTTASTASCSSRTATPTNPPVNPKESKDRRNRERLLRAAGSSAGSDFSLGPDTELEMDYYDYNVHNACAAPGSLLGMDPAYLLWIPPFTPGSWEDDGEEGDGAGQLFDADGSNSAQDHEETEMQDLSSVPVSGSGDTCVGSGRRQFVTLPGSGAQERALIHTARVTELTVKEKDDMKAVPALTLEELTSSPRRPGRPARQDWHLDHEKETAVVKSPSDQRLLYRLHDDDDDIRFADDGDDDCEDIFCKDSKVDPKTVPLLGRREDFNV